MTGESNASPVCLYRSKRERLVAVYVSIVLVQICCRCSSSFVVVVVVTSRAACKLPPREATSIMVFFYVPSVSWWWWCCWVVGGSVCSVCGQRRRLRYIVDTWKWNNCCIRRLSRAGESNASLVCLYRGIREGLIAVYVSIVVLGKRRCRCWGLWSLS